MLEISQEFLHRACFYEKYLKRLLDIGLSICALIVLSPVMLILAFLVKIKLGSPVVFCQDRAGKDEQVFKMYKFRSMKNEKDKDGILLPDSIRLTTFGKALRSTSLDELPELWNILNGDMSIVGPRPLTLDYLPYYNELEKHRHDVKPGLTGLAQVNGRTAIEWDKRFAYDIQYVQKLSFVFDVIIILKTVKKVFKKADVVQAGQQGSFDEYRKKQWKEQEIL